MRLLGSALAVILLSFGAYAQQAPAQSPTSGFLGVLPMMIIMFVIIYFLMIRPEQKKQKDRQKMIGNVQKGDRIVTIGGVYGTVGNVKDNSIMVKVAENTVIEIRKSAVAEVLGDKTEEAVQKGAKGA